MKVAVVGHVEWAHFVKVDQTPQGGEIVRSNQSWHEAGGGGGVAAGQLAKLAGSCTLFTAVGDDDAGEKVIEQLKTLGVEVYATKVKDSPTKEAIVHLEADKERNITVIGDLKPSGKDKTLPWEKLAEMDAVYFVSGDAEALKAARKAKKLVATARVLPVLKEAAVQLDGLVMSRKDEGELYAPGDLDPAPGLVVKTGGTDGGFTETGESYAAEVVAPIDLKDLYGCGDSFAAGLTFALGEGKSTDEALKLAAHCGADAAMRNGAHGIVK
jgi:ribokinase